MPVFDQETPPRPPSTLADVQETRLAVAFYGGVALAVYESGVAVELFRLVKSEGVYRELRAFTGPVSVDIITGTSAGGLNGAILGNALVNGGDVTKLLTLWCQEGDIGKLLYGLGKASPGSLLDGDRFKQKIFEALLARRAVSAQERSLQTFLDLFVTATNLDGDRVVIETPDHDVIPTRTHRQVFHFAYNDPGPGDDDEERNDFLGDDNLCRLAVAARTTASFPLAFEPVLVTREQLGVRAAHLDADAYHIDGGVLDNKPIALATAAIAARRADRQVNRLLFYVEPDPEEIVPRACQTTPEAYSAFAVALKAIAPLPSYQSITGALQDLQRHNEEVAERRRLLAYFETTAARYRRSKGGRIETDTAPDGIEGGKEATGVTFVPVTDRASALYRAEEDGYLALRMEALAKPLFEAYALLARRARERPDDSDALAPDLYVLTRAILDAFDLEYERRLYRYLVHVLRGVYPRPLEDSSTAPPWYLTTVAALNALKDVFYDHEALVRRQAASSSNEQASEIERLEAQLREAGEILRAQVPEEAALRASQEVIAQLARQVADSAFATDRRTFAHALRRAVWRRLRNDTLALLQTLDAPAMQAPDDVRAGIRDGYWVLRDALDSFFLRDIMLYPLLQNGDLSAELDNVRFARISPADADLYIPGLTAQQKLAGESLAHFGGFLEETWRGNDLTWGRLDSAEILIRKLLPADQWDARGRDLVRRAQREIADEMKSRGMGIYAGPEETRANLIGEETPAVIPFDRKVNWSGRAAVTLLKIVRRSLEEIHAQWLTRRLVGALNVVIAVATGVCMFFAVLLGAFRRSRMLGWLLAVLAIAIVAIMLWERSGCGWARAVFPQLRCALAP